MGWNRAADWLRPALVRKFDIGQGKVREIRKSQRHCRLPVLC